MPNPLEINRIKIKIKPNQGEPQIHSRSRHRVTKSKTTSQTTKSYFNQQATLNFLSDTTIQYPVP